VSLGLLQLAAGLLVGLGLLALGAYIGLGVREDREADRAAKVALARIAARQGREIVYLMAPPPADRPRMPTGMPNYHPADLLPRAGRLALEPAEVPQLPHGPASRPIPSLVDLDGAVRLMCIEAEMYVAGLIAHSRHAERGHPW
jgi:hypothetical protein